MITSQRYTRILRQRHAEIEEAVRMDANSEDMKVVNDKVLVAAQDLLKLALMYKGQEEGPSAKT